MFPFPVILFVPLSGRILELGIEYLVGGACRPAHTGFMFVEADDMAKVTELMRPTIGRDECVITPVTER